jgi:hypothetical protein
MTRVRRPVPLLPLPEKRARPRFPFSVLSAGLPQALVNVRGADLSTNHSPPPRWVGSCADSTPMGRDSTFFPGSPGCLSGRFGASKSAQKPLTHPNFLLVYSLVLGAYAPRGRINHMSIRTRFDPPRSVISSRGFGPTATYKSRDCRTSGSRSRALLPDAELFLEVMHGDGVQRPRIVPLHKRRRIRGRLRQPGKQNGKVIGALGFVPQRVLE